MDVGGLLDVGKAGMELGVMLDLEEPKRAVAFRSDLGKRDESDVDRGMVPRVARALSRSRPFKTDLGKRRSGGGRYMFRSDLGRRSALPWNTGADTDPEEAASVDRRRAMFRSDLGKRVPDSYSRRMFRTDLGKRSLMFRHDLG